MPFYASDLYEEDRANARKTGEQAHQDPQAASPYVPATSSPTTGCPSKRISLTDNAIGGAGTDSMEGGARYMQFHEHPMNTLGRGAGVCQR